MAYNNIVRNLHVYNLQFLHVILFLYFCRNNVKSFERCLLRCNSIKIYLFNYSKIQIYLMQLFKTYQNKIGNRNMCLQAFKLIYLANNKLISVS